MNFKNKSKVFTHQNFSKKNAAGFTLIEVLVSVVIFLMTIMAVSQIFISVIRSERAAYALLNSENNIRNNLELMARGIRMGTEFQDNTSNLSQLCFTNSKGNPQCFIFESETLNQELNGITQSLLDPLITIVSGHFYQIGGTTDSQKTIIIQLEAQVEVRNQIIYPFHVETVVTPRTLK